MGKTYKDSKDYKGKSRYPKKKHQHKPAEHDEKDLKKIPLKGRDKPLNSSS